MLKTLPNRMSEFVPSLTRNVNAIFKQILFVVFFFILAQKQAFSDSSLHTDARASFNGRTYPVGAQIVGNLGVSYPLWGDTTNWKYGYVRLGANIMTSAIVNRAGLEFQFFPISIFGITLSYDTGVRNFVPRWLDCNVYECTGRVDRKHVRGTFVAAHSGFAMMLMARFEELRGFGSGKPVFDETSLVIGQRSGERIFTFNPVVLYKVSEKTQVGFASLFSHALDTGGSTHLYGPVVNLNPKPKFNALLGAGMVSSTLVHSAICGFFLLQYNIKPSLAVVDLALRNSTPGVSESRDQ